MVKHCNNLQMNILDLISDINPHFYSKLKTTGKSGVYGLAVAAEIWPTIIWTAHKKTKCQIYRSMTSETKWEVENIQSSWDLQVEQLKNTSCEMVICMSLGDERHFQPNIIKHHFIVTFIFTAHWIVLMTFHLNFTKVYTVSNRKTVYSNSAVSCSMFQKSTSRVSCI